MKTNSRFKVSSLSVVLASICLTLGGCSSSATENKTPEGNATATVQAAQTPTAETVKLPDPRSLTGISEVANIPDPEPIGGEINQKLPVTVKDFNGNEVTVTDTSRIIPIDINGTISRVVIGLGYGKNIVGRTVSSVEEQLKDVPVITERGHSLNVEAIMGLKPTLILADRTVGPPEALEQLRNAGIPVVMLNPERKIETTGPEIEKISEAMGIPEAGKRLAERTEKEVKIASEQISKWTPEKPLRGAFLYVRGKAGIFFILGEENGASALLKAVGVKDLASENGIKTLAPASAEALVKLNPEVIFVMEDGLKSTGGVEGLLSRPGVKNTEAGKKTRIISIPDGISLSFGPQTGTVLTNVAKKLYGIEK
ncbi:ABC transporter substrate-binding protein [Actinomycetaceae bacterium TAE3-ERU4]|nr:ABC transporter substrate-binding protein [Actinomycetaceae bacterium TAE3-ERU4]